MRLDQRLQFCNLNSGPRHQGAIIYPSEDQSLPPRESLFSQALSDAGLTANRRVLLPLPGVFYGTF